MEEYEYICPKCDTPHSAEEFRESRFCRVCGRFLPTSSRTRFQSGDLPRTDATPVKVRDFSDLFPYEPYAEQMKFMQDIKEALGQGGTLVAEACNGFGKTICSLCSILPIGKRIIYATRTHEQVRQVLREIEQINKKARTEFSAVALASRQNLCLNSACRRLPPVEAFETCKALRKNGKCLYKTDFSMDSVILPRSLSVRRLLLLGKSKRFCPYFLSRKAAENCTLVVAPYQYIFNESIRNRMNLSIKDKIVIFDESHNADKIGQEVLSDFLTERSLRNARKELQLIRAPTAFISDLEDYLERSILEETIVKQGSSLLQDLKGILGNDIPFMIDTFNHIADEIRTARTKRGEVPICFLSGIMSFLSLVDSSETEDYIAIYRRTSMGTKRIEYRCLNPSLGIKPVIEEASGALIMSGTLSPMELFTEILGLSNAKTRTYLAIAKPENIRTYVDKTVTTRFQERSTEMTLCYGDRISGLMNRVPNGALIFFPQRKLMLESLNLWRKHGPIRKEGKDLFLGKKKIFIEGEQASSNSRIVDNYKNSAASASGAVLFAVFRGRNAEGSNFPYDEARGIFLVGLPFADYGDPVVSAQIRYFDKKKSGLGELWYIMDAFRAANQAMGRGIRHIDDWCHFFLMDRRYATHWRLISKWVTQNGVEEISFGQD